MLGVSGPTYLGKFFEDFYDTNILELAYLNSDWFLHITYWDVCIFRPQVLKIFTKATLTPPTHLGITRLPSGAVHPACII